MITFAPEVEQRLISSIQRYFEKNMDEEIGELKATLLLEFFAKEIGPSIYNRAIADAQAQLQEHVAEIEESCYEPEFGYWER